MSTARDFRGILEKLSSDKVKERTEGVTRCREFLSSKRNFNALCNDRSHSWLETLQSAFNCVIRERNAVAAKRTGPAEKRLDDAANLVKFLVEKLTPLIPRKTAKAIVAHLTQMMAVHGKLQDYALTYLKALRTVLAYPPHLEHLDEKMWCDVVSLCFSTVLGDKVVIGRQFADDVAMDIDSDPEDDSGGCGGRSGSGSGVGRKRGRGALVTNSNDERLPPPPTGTAASSSARKKGFSKRTANPVEIELLHVLEVAFRARHSPFLTYAHALFRKFLRFFRLFPYETSAHHPALVALNRAFAELDLNDQRSMRKLGPHLWSPILQLWQTKNQGLKEQVLVALRYLFPFVVPTKAAAATSGAAGGADDEEDAVRRAKELYEAVLSEPTIRWREPFELDVDHLRLGLSRPGEEGEEEGKAFHGRTFRIGSGFDDKAAVAWSTVELGAMALARIYEVGESSGGGREDGLDAFLSPTQRGKRRKVDDPLTVLLDSLSDASHPLNLIAFRLKILLFLVDRHWDKLSEEARRRILDALVPLLSHSDSQIERWTFVAVAAVVHAGLPQQDNPLDDFSAARKHRRESSSSTPWEQVWLLALRRLTSPELCRTAAHTANVLLAHDRIPIGVLIESIDTFAKDLDVQGLNFPSDAICFFLEWILAIAASDARLFRLKLPQKILGWITTAWRPLDGIHRAHSFGQSRPQADPLSVSGLVSLLARLSAAVDVPKVVDDYLVPDCPCATMAIELGETARVRDFIEAKVPAYWKDDSQKANGIRTPSFYNSAGGAGAHDERQRDQTPKRISGWLQRTLDGFKADASGMGDSYWCGMANDLARRHLDWASLALTVEGLFKLNKLPSRKETIRSATDILTFLAPTLALKKWHPSERAHLLAALNPILVSIPDRPAVTYPVLLDPSDASGIPHDLIPRRSSTPSSRRQVDLDSLEFAHLRTIWNDDLVRTALEEVLSALRFILREVTESPSPPGTASANGSNGASSSSSSFGFGSQMPSTQASQKIKELEATQKADDFGEVRVGSRAASVLGSSSSSGGDSSSGGMGGYGPARAGAATIQACIRGFVSAEMASSGGSGGTGSTSRPARIQEIVDAILAAENGDDSIVLAEQAFEASLAGLVTFGLAQAEAVIQHIGEDLLPDYRYARDERFARVALRFLECTTGLWVKAGDAEEEFGGFARTLAAWYVSGLRKKIFASWRVRLQFLALLDKYLELDPTQQSWDLDGQALRAEDGLLITPSAIVPFMLSDGDFRVRFRAATSSANLFNLCRALGLSEQNVFNDIKSNLPFNLNESEQILTQILCNTNLLIVAGTRRRAPLNLLVKNASDQPRYTPVTIAALEGAAARLGFNSLADLYLPYARYFLWIELRTNPNSLGPDLGQRLAFRACGFPTLRDARRADFNMTASLLLQNIGSLSAYRTTCDVLKRSEQDGRLACLPETIALAILYFFGDHKEEMTPPYEVLQAQICTLAEGAGAGDQHQQDKLIDSVVDEIFVEMIALGYDAFWAAGQPHPGLAHDDKAAATFTSLLGLKTDMYLDVEPPPPLWPTDLTAQACVWFDKERRMFSDPAVVFSVLHHLLDRVHRAHFVSEQRRQLLNLALAISLSHRGIKEQGVLATLGDGLIRLLSSFDTLALVSPMLNWTFHEWLALEAKSKTPDRSVLSEQLVRAAHAAAALDKRAREVQWVEAVEYVAMLSKALSSLARQLVKLGDPKAVNIAFLWPTREFNPRGLDYIDTTLSSSFAPVGKFSIVSVLQQHKEYDALCQRDDRSRILWRLLQAIGPNEELSQQDCLAFANLLYDFGGETEPPSVDELSRSYEEATDDGGVDGETGIKKLVAERVLHHLHSSEPHLIAAAFSTAKLVFSVPGTETLFPSNDSSLSAVLANYLSSPSLRRPLRLRRRLPRKLTELRSDELLNARDFSRWVRRVAELLGDARAEGDDFYAQLNHLIQLSSTFATEVVPLLVHCVLVQDTSAGETDAQKHVSDFFEQILKKPSSSVEAVRLVVDTAIYLRRHGRPDLNPSSPSRFDSWLSVSWVQLAEGAVKTGAYLAGLLFLELGHEHWQLFRLDQNGAPLDCKLDEQGQKFLYEIYSEIDEPDGFYGRESPDVRQALLRRYRHEKDWEGAFRLYGARHEAQAYQLGMQDSAATGGVVNSLAAFGFNRLAMSVFQPARLDGSLKADDVSAELPYELAWRTDVWDLPVERQAAGASSVSLYSALRATRTSRSAASVHAVATAALSDEVRKLSAVTLDLPRPNNEALSTILALREVNSLAVLKEGDKLTSDFAGKLASVPTKLSFDQAERVLSSRISVLRGIRTKERIDQVGDELSSELYQRATAAERACLIELSRVARRSGQLQAALNAVTVAHSLVDDKKSVEVDEELANVLWAQGEHSTAITVLSAILRQSSSRLSVNLARLGEWHGEARMRSSAQILDESFEPAVRALTRDAQPSERALVFHSFAAFADAQFEDLNKDLAERRKRAELYERRKEFEFAEIDRQLQMLQNDSPNSSRLMRSKSLAQGHLEEDKRMLEEAEKTAKTMLWRSVENYAKALEASDDYDDKVFRMCGLWLAYSDNDDLHTKLNPLLRAIPSRKFVFLAYQLSARLTKSSTPNPSAVNVQQLVTRLCIEHPFHSLYPVNSLRDLSATKAARRSSTNSGEPVSKNSRAQAANDIVDKVKRTDGLRPRVEAIELLLEAYAEWAEFDLKTYSGYVEQRRVRKGLLPIRPSMKLVTKVKNLPVPVMTFDLPVDPSGRYDENSFPHIVRYSDKFDTAGGVNLPKIVTCIGSDGQAYKQLLKGNDDIRQDAVMEQLFALVNTLLNRDEGGRRRKLHLRTYKVIPLQGSNGLIEFAANTVPLGSVLSRLYDQMAPGKVQKARRDLGEIEGRYKGRPKDRDRKKREEFGKIMKDFPPLMRYLFWQKHKVPSLWFDMRLNYSRSVATNSIVGHLVGLGDRHVSNILIDEARGELVHIDFGIAFDQGRRLPIPELVPFRLTHNLVDGFGMSGVEGVFRRCSEETLRVLRERSSVIMTVLEVFKYDPLQNWAVSSEMAKRIQGSDDGEAVALDELPDDADHALSKVRARLDTSLSVQYTVNQLIQEATNQDNLAVIFSGWQPTL
ncbi:hypothetical protein JCM8547_006527 [Rhodosporidiobolus lusitaniae]